MHRSPSRHRAVASSGLRLDVREHTPGGPGRPTVVLVHGYPDRQETWQPLLAALGAEAAEPDLHLVSYDVRGAGGSGVPHGVAGYDAALLVDDLVAVLDAVLPPGGRAHLVGHDWGSVQLWDAVAAERTDPRLHDRLASFTSVSGPSLDHLGSLLRRPRGRRRALVRQLLHSWYVCLFLVPRLPELLWRRWHRPLARALARREGLPADHWGPGLAADAAHGVNLYRANVLRRVRRPRPLSVRVPVLVLRPERDAYLTDLVTADLDRHCDDVEVVRLDAGHWVIATHPAEVAARVRRHVAGHP